MALIARPGAWLSDRGSEPRATLTMPFWLGAALLIVPSTIMILAVLGTLPIWIGVILFLILFSLPIPASAWIIGEGWRSWQGDDAGATPPAASERIGAAVSIVLGIVVGLVGLGFLLNAIVRLIILG